MLEIAPADYTILIVDDNPTNLGVVTDYLASYGFNLLTALDGEDGLETALAALPHLILLDIMMPGIDGLEVCRRLKADPATRHIPVIFMSALAGVDDKVRGFEVGSVDYVTKPIQQEELLARVNTHLRLQSLTRELHASLNETGELLAAAKGILGATQLDEICGNLLNHFSCLVQADRVTLFLVDHEVRQVTFRMGHGRIRDDLDAGYQELDDGISGLVFRAVREGELSLETPQGPYRLAPGQPVLSLSADDGIEPAATRERRRRAGTGTLIVVPLVARGRVIGTATAMNQADQRPFTSHDVDLLMTLAAQAATAIDNLRLFEQSLRDREALDASYRREQERRRLSDTLREVAKIVSSTLDRDQVLELILTQLDQVITYHRAMVTLQVGGELILVGGRDKSGRAIEPFTIPVNLYPLNARVLQNKSPLLIPDVRRDERWLAIQPFHSSGSFINAPLLVHDRPVGLLGVLRNDEVPYTSEDAEIVFAFASQVAIALENARLYDESRRFNEELERLVQARTEELNRAYHKLERLDKTKSDFIAVVAHELRTPLTVLSGYAQVLAGLPAVAADEAVRQVVDGILVGESRMQEIVNGILDVIRIDVQTMNLNRRRTLIKNVVEMVQSEFTFSLNERHLTLELDGLDAVPAVYADADWIRKVFYHLIGNAIKYTTDGGRITVQGRATTLDDLGTPGVEIRVSDTGIGIDPMHHELIFEKFYQTGEVAVHSSGRTKFKGGGPGVGLAIARGIVEAHGGRIWVESDGCNEETCPGSTFYVVLPLGQN